jgi:putative (di)nucleoside polyphosphate hydrolase
MLRKKLRYRLNVAGMLMTPGGDLLICERLNLPGAWQFPQGGVDRGETLEEAITRELFEEIGVTADQWIERQQAGPFRYHFEAGRLIRGYCGKDQHFFLLEYLADPLAIDVHQPSAEFRSYQWIRPRDFDLCWVPITKRAMYQQVFEQLLGLPLR